MIKLIVGFLFLFLITFVFLAGAYILGIIHSKASNLRVVKVNATLAFVLVVILAVVSSIVLVF